LIKWIQDYEDVFTEFVSLGQKTWKYEDIKKRRWVQNAQNIGMVVRLFRELVNGKSFTETHNFLGSHSIRHDQQNNERRSRQVHNTHQSPGTDITKKDKRILF
jgi:hypothetical protein